MIELPTVLYAAYVQCMACHIDKPIEIIITLHDVNGQACYKPRGAARSGRHSTYRPKIGQRRPGLVWTV